MCKIDIIPALLPLPVNASIVSDVYKRQLIIVLFSVFTLLGFIGYKNLSYELMPDFNQPVVVIKTVYPGAEPNEVETSVSRKIEDALSLSLIHIWSTCFFS